MQNFLSYGGGYGNWGMMPSGYVAGGALVMAWSIFWKGHALWHAAGKRQGWWFLALLVINTMGILEIAYLFYFLKLRKEEAFPWLKR